MQTIIFDFGNVVGFFDHGRTLNRLQEFTDMTPAEMFQAVYATPLEDAVEEGKLSKADFLREVKKIWRLNCDEEILCAAVANIFTPNQEVCSLIPQLRPRYRILLGSNTNVVHADHYRQEFAETLAHFHSLVMSHEVGVRKPNAQFFRHCLERAECPAEKCLFIDDLAANVAAARELGMKGIVYRPGNGLVASMREMGISV